jgi:hypothetical protein
MAKDKKVKLGGLDDQLRAAIASSELTLHAISQGSGVSYPQVFYFAAGSRDIRLSGAAKIAAFLGLHLAPLEP